MRGSARTVETEAGGPSDLEQFVHERIGERASRIDELLASGAELLEQSRRVMRELDAALRQGSR